MMGNNKRVTAHTREKRENNQTAGKEKGHGRDYGRKQKEMEI